MPSTAPHEPTKTTLADDVIITITYKCGMCDELHTRPMILNGEGRKGARLYPDWVWVPKDPRIYTMIQTGALWGLLCTQVLGSVEGDVARRRVAQFGRDMEGFTRLWMDKNQRLLALADREDEIEVVDTDVFFYLDRLWTSSDNIPGGGDLVCITHTSGLAMVGKLQKGTKGEPDGITVSPTSCDPAWKKFLMPVGDGPSPETVLA